MKFIKILLQFKGLFMSLVISNANNPIRICLDTPYKDGIANIKAALWPNDGRISYSFGMVSVSDRVVDLSKRIIQLSVGIVLMLPVVNVIVSLAIRFFPCKDNEQTQGFGENEPYSIASKSILKNVPRRVLQFLDENGVKGTSVRCGYPFDNHPFSYIASLFPMLPLRPIPNTPSLKFTIHSNTMDKVIIHIYNQSQYSERSMYEEIKRQIVASGIIHPRN